MPGRFNSVYYPDTLNVEDATRIAVGAKTRDELLFKVEWIPTVPVAGRVIDSQGGGRRRDDHPPAG